MSCTCDKPHEHPPTTAVIVLVTFVVVLLLLFLGVAVGNVHICGDEIVAGLLLLRSPAVTWQWLGLLLRSLLP